MELHRLRIRWNYSEQDVEVLRPMYEQAYRLLDLSEDVAVSAEVRRLKQQLIVQEREISRLRAIVERVGPLQPLGSILLDSRPKCGGD